jgi:hypothetical protein
MQWQNQKPQTMIYKLFIEQHEPHQKPGMNSVALEGKSVPAPLVAPIE